MSFKVLYRGSLVSCNYGCEYCPFAKRRETREEMERDRLEVGRFVSWVRELERPIELLFTPWGEALIRPWYQEALVELSRLEHVRRVAIQTNLSAPLAWSEGACRETLALWATFHPGEIARERFLAKCRELDQRGFRYSVGIVGLREHFEDMEALRAALDPEVYLWVNAYKRQADYYSVAERERVRAVDPLFDLNADYHPSLGRSCRAGTDAFTVDGEGTLRRCHFIKAPLGNVYEEDLDALLGPSPCSQETCGCYIGYVHLEHLGLYETYGAGVMERIPARPLPAAAR